MSAVLNQCFKDYKMVFEEQNNRLTKKNKRADRLIIEKGELIGEKFMEILLLEHVFLDKQQTEQSYQIVLSNIYKLLKNDTQLDKEIVKRILFKMWMQKDYVKLNELKEELLPYVQNILNDLPQMPSLDISDLPKQPKEPKFCLRVLNSSIESISRDSSNLLKTFQKDMNQTVEFKFDISNQLSSFDSEEDAVKRYLNNEVMHTKTQLTEFCHQMKIPEPRYQRRHSMEEHKKFVMKCVITIPSQEQDKFNRVQYVNEGVSLNSKSASSEAAKKVLYMIYFGNPKTWERFKEIKKKKGLST